MIQFIGIVVLLAVVGTAIGIRHVYNSGAEAAEYRLVAESAETLRKARDHQARLTAQAREDQRVAESQADEARKEGRKQAAAARQARKDAEEKETCPDLCFLVSPRPSS